MNDISQMLPQLESGNPSAPEELLPLVYDELRKLAVARLAQEKPGQTLQATALVHEAFLRILGAGTAWNGRAHFFASAAEAMRRILVESARRKRRAKRGGSWRRIDLEQVPPSTANFAPELLDVNMALDAFAQVDPTKAELVKLRYFAGLSLDESAIILGISPATADRYWKYARAWLAARMRDAYPDANEQGNG